MLNLKSMKLSSKILFGSLASIVAFVGLLAYIYPNIKKIGYEGKREKIMNLVESAMGILEQYDALVKSGQWNLADG